MAGERTWKYCAACTATSFIQVVFAVWGASWHDWDKHSTGEMYVGLKFAAVMAVAAVGCAFVRGPACAYVGGLPAWISFFILGYKSVKHVDAREILRPKRDAADLFHFYYWQTVVCFASAYYCWNREYFIRKQEAADLKKQKRREVREASRKANKAE
mmetsp:Transcript_9380/g.21331  ORF Transcript_9380/g.21331 Transcript_9380/m.21331 type:complete len:157 (+) Transcript_9380:68-538(+)|eukprot:CAMPEP_0197893982 /NCGR_PEP_ID=MMETSP1439-20131203/34029_1 /TAXON_ID=66791 /ORGANISM="Gonyaulax spinifera, Strain CCMP409" /LENGTH=156 /DNA_ID=CAMNT_0043514293 /DNA_START=62 /DNA_END=532 /DNA_ORIENTATION=-